MSTTSRERGYRAGAHHPHRFIPGEAGAASVFEFGEEWIRRVSGSTANRLENLACPGWRAVMVRSRPSSSPHPACSPIQDGIAQTGSGSCQQGEARVPRMPARDPSGCQAPRRAAAAVDGRWRSHHDDDDCHRAGGDP